MKPDDSLVVELPAEFLEGSVSQLLDRVFPADEEGRLLITERFDPRANPDLPDIYAVLLAVCEEWRDWRCALSVSTGRELVAPDGSRGLYFYRLADENLPFSTVQRTYTLLAASLLPVDDNLALWIRRSSTGVLADLSPYVASRMNLRFNSDIFGETYFQALNPGEGFGLLRQLEADERPHSRDVVIYETLPNELPRVAGIISTVPQTPLSHVNLRATQNGVPKPT